MFKWPQSPTPNEDEHEIADFVELVAWRDGQMSVVELNQLLGRQDDADYSFGVPVEDEVDVHVEAVFAELEHRYKACAGRYPFSICEGGRTVRMTSSTDASTQTIYMYLLLATRLNMKDNRIHGDLDGTKLFEEVAADSAGRYLGNRARSLVFGTSQGVGFVEKVNNLCRRVGEGGGFNDHSSGGTTQRDGKLDIVAWTPFSDEQPGKLILFGQCKTGTHYRNDLTQLQPRSFCDKWFRSPPVLAPTRAFFVTEALPSSRWRETAIDAGLLFDRCRIMDFSESISAGVLERVRAWTKAAAHAAALPTYY